MRQIRGRNAWYVAALLALSAMLPVLQGCIPVIAAGAVGGALVMDDRRTSGTILDDEGIEQKAYAAVNQDLGNQVHVNVTSYNGNVLLTGEAPSAELKGKIQQRVTPIPKVRGVVDEVKIAGLSSLGSRSDDALITAKVKAAFVNGNRFHPNHVKVVTEAGVVHLLGLVTKQESDDAVELARGVSGVRKVVKVFEEIKK